MRAPDPSAPVRRRPLALAVLAAAVLAVLSPRAAPAEESWERPVRDAVVEQDKELARTSAKQLINRYSSRLSRQRGEKDVVTLYLLARAYGKAKDPENALATYAEVIQAEPRLWYAWRDRALLKWEKRDAAGAEADLRQAIALNPEYATALQDLATILLAGGGKGAEEATRLLSRVLDVEPQNEKARFQLVRAFLALGRADDAMRALQPMIAREPNHPGLRLVRAEVLAVQGRFDDSWADLKRLAQDNPASAEPLKAWLATAKLAERAKKPVSAEDLVWVFERLARLERSEPQRRALLEQVGKIRQAQAQARAAETPQPASPPTSEQIANVLRTGDDRTRTALLSILVLRARPGQEIEAPLTAALVERALKDPLPEVRRMALAVLGQAGAAARPLAPVLRLALYDDDPEVRARAADVLGDVGAKGSLAALHASAAGDPSLRDEAARAAVAVAAQAAAYRIAGTSPTLPEDATPVQATEAYRAWWKDPARTDVKLAAIEDVLRDVLRGGEAAPWFLLWTFVEDEDPRVWARSWYAFRSVAAKATGPSPREVWLRELPSFDPATLGPEKRPAYVEAMTAWWARRPR